MLPDRTTTTGDSLPVTHIKPFHMISAEVTIIPVTIFFIEKSSFTGTKKVRNTCKSLHYFEIGPPIFFKEKLFDLSYSPKLNQNFDSLAKRTFGIAKFNKIAAEFNTISSSSTKNN